MPSHSLSRGLWSTPGVPHRGWRCLSIYDVKEDDSDADLLTCGMCQSAQIRFVHVMEHDDYDGQVQAGCICAGHMEQDRAAATGRERQAKSRADRRARWLKRKWRVSAKGNPWLKDRGSQVILLPAGTGYRVSINRQIKPQWFATLDEAKLAAFDALYPPASPPIPAST